MASLGDFSSAWRFSGVPTPGERHPNATGCLQQSRQSATISFRAESHAGRHAGARSDSN
jgi:hypothetical protein